ncbi:MAG: S8 family serine peptidase [candidate division WOR-3 bacterium]
MRWLTLLISTAMVYAVDIHSHGSTVPFAPLPDENPTIISFSNGIVFDTRDGEPVLPARLKIESYPDKGYYLIQMVGPVYSYYLDELKELGIDIIGYIPKYTLIGYANQTQIELARNKSFVRWTGIFQPAYKIQSELLNCNGTARITIQLFPDEDAYSIANNIQSLGFDVVEIIDHNLCKTIDAIIDLTRIHEIARITGVQWIQLWSEPAHCNNNCQWVTQTGWRATVPSDPGARRIWYEGLRGSGIILSTTDTGIHTSHYQFYDAAYPITAPGIFPNHRKIIAYKLYSGAAFGDVSAGYWHGTHVNCTVGGNDTTLGTSVYDGMAKEARIYFVDIGNASGGLVLSTNLTAVWDTVYLGRGLGFNILQHSGSWGWLNSNGTYLTQDATTDAYCYAHPDFLNIIAAGNEYNPRTLRNPGIAKNVLTVGATLNSTSSNQIASFSSRGYTLDRRIKPNVMAPGDGASLWAGLMSAQGGTTNSYWGMSGTSMATPAVNGSIGLIRQYLLAGFYPTGAANPSDSIKYQSSALLRAMAIVSCDPNIGSYVVPDSNIGWGRIDLDSVLYFASDTRHLIIKDDTIGVGTGESITDSFVVLSSSSPLRIAVAWTDTAAAANANPTLVNDINVTLTAPNGTYYRGNIYSGGQSAANPTNWDNRNVEECFRVNSPATGVWKLTIAGQNIPNAPMGFAYAITGNIGFVGIEENEGACTQTKDDFSFSTITRGFLNLSINISTPREVNINVYNLSGRLVMKLLDGRLPAGKTEVKRPLSLPTGIYFIEIKTEDRVRYGKIIVLD